MKAWGTKNAIFHLRMICVRFIQHQQTIFFVHRYRRPFDRIRPKEFLKMLKIKIRDKDLRIIRSCRKSEDDCSTLQKETLLGWMSNEGLSKDVSCHDAC